MSSIDNADHSSDDVSGLLTGTHEVQECFEGQGEADLHSHVTNCKKNPGHSEFVPVNKFTMQDIPSGYQDKELFNFIQLFADLTVRIAVKFTSPDRPEFLPGTKNPYPCYNSRGQNSLHTGTGRVTCVDKYTQLTWDGPCPCPECEHSDTPSKRWWKVCVLTAKHVVFDDSEAKQTSCRLHFDDDTSPVVKFHAWKVDQRSTDNDRSMLFCVTHDLDLFKELYDSWKQCELAWKELMRKYANCRNKDKVAIIVSHPHGCSKQVSVGRWVDRQAEPKYHTWYRYTTCTCPGSSGASVYRVGYPLTEHPHSKANSADGLNHSGKIIQVEFSDYTEN